MEDITLVRGQATRFFVTVTVWHFGTTNQGTPEFDVALLPLFDDDVGGSDHHSVGRSTRKGRQRYAESGHEKSEQQSTCLHRAGSAAEPVSFGTAGGCEDQGQEAYIPCQVVRNMKIQPKAAMVGIAGPDSERVCKLILRSPCHLTKRYVHVVPIRPYAL